MFKIQNNALVIKFSLTQEQYNRARQHALDSLAVRDEKNNMVYRVASYFGNTSDQSPQTFVPNAVVDGVIAQVIQLPVFTRTEDRDDFIEGAYLPYLAAVETYAPIVKAQVEAKLDVINRVITSIVDEDTTA